MLGLLYTFMYTLILLVVYVHSYVRETWEGLTPMLGVTFLYVVFMDAHY